MSKPETRREVMLALIAVRQPSDGMDGIVKIAADIADFIDGTTAAALPEPAVPINKSVTPDLIHCLDCKFKGKMIKRHLANAHSMTPEQYRARWNLPSDYPMTAPSYAKRRSSIAKEFGLGKSKKPVRRKK